MRSINTSKWSPGPWHVRDINYQGALGQHVIVSDSDRDGECTALVHGDSRKQLDANARLISRAPEMAELLAKLSQQHFDTCDSVKSGTPEYSLDYSCSCGVAEARALLAEL